VADTTSVPTLTLQGAQRVLEGSVAHALSIGVPVCIAVADRSGALLAFARMDGAPQMSATIAQDKAYTVAAFAGLPTHQWYDLIKDDPPVLHGIVKTDRLIVFGGGVPIRSAGELAGTVGVSGGSSDQDRAIAEAGASLVN
jgi:uncharacterized protein GlcG (DUF336 family)